jgi:hypothetical protein
MQDTILPPKEQLINPHANSVSLAHTQIKLVRNLVLNVLQEPTLELLEQPPRLFAKNVLQEPILGPLEQPHHLFVKSANLGPIPQLKEQLINLLANSVLLAHTLILLVQHHALNVLQEPILGPLEQLHHLFAKNAKPEPSPQLKEQLINQLVKSVDLDTFHQMKELLLNQHANNVSLEHMLTSLARHHALNAR